MDFDEVKTLCAIRFEDFKLEEERKRWEKFPRAVARNFGSFFDVSRCGIDRDTISEILTFETGQIIDICSTIPMLDMIEAKRLEKLKKLKMRIESFRLVENNPDLARMVEETIKYLENNFGSTEQSKNLAAKVAGDMLIEGRHWDEWIGYAKKLEKDVKGLEIEKELFKRQIRALSEQVQVLSERDRAPSENPWASIEKSREEQINFPGDSSSSQ